MSEIYQAGTLKRKRRTNDQIEQLDFQIVEALEADQIGGAAYG